MPKDLTYTPVQVGYNFDFALLGIIQAIISLKKCGILRIDSAVFGLEELAAHYY